jgi:hypothetical protein
MTVMIDDGSWKPELGADGSDKVGRLLEKICNVSNVLQYKKLIDQCRPSDHLSVPIDSTTIMYTLNSISTLALVLAVSLSVHASPIAEDAKLESRATIDCGGASETSQICL